MHSYCTVIRDCEIVIVYFLFHFKFKIVEEVIDEFKHEHMLLSITGYDAAVLDSYVKFVRNAAQMTEVNLTKR